MWKDTSRILEVQKLEEENSAVHHFRKENLGCKNVTLKKVQVLGQEEVLLPCFRLKTGRVSDGGHKVKKVQKVFKREKPATTLVFS